MVVLKGDDTLIAEPPAGLRRGQPRRAAPALATAGTGDVLTGVIAALLAQGSTPSRRPPRACGCTPQAGGRRRAGSARPEGVIASDVIDALPAVRAAAGAETRGEGGGDERRWRCGPARELGAAQGAARAR